jgi:hypothetical protein
MRTDLWQILGPKKEEAAGMSIKVKKIRASLPVPLTKHYDKIKEVMICKECSTHGEDEKFTHLIRKI